MRRGKGVKSMNHSFENFLFIKNRILFYWSIKLNKIVFMQTSMRLNKNVWKCHNWM